MTYTGLEDINVTDISSILGFPLTGDPYFWAKIFLAFWVILTSIFFFEERARLGKGNLLSSLAFSSIAIVVLASIGSLIGIMNNEILIPIVVLAGVFIFIWFIKQDR